MSGEVAVVVEVQEEIRQRSLVARRSRGKNTRPVHRSRFVAPGSVRGLRRGKLFPQFHPPAKPRAKRPQFRASGKAEG